MCPQVTQTPEGVASMRHTSECPWADSSALSLTGPHCSSTLRTHSTRPVRKFLQPAHKAGLDGILVACLW
jgi:hypothetical protein